MGVDVVSSVPAGGPVAHREHRGASSSRSRSGARRPPRPRGRRLRRWRRIRDRRSAATRGPPSPRPGSSGTTAPGTTSIRWRGCGTTEARPFVRADVGSRGIAPYAKHPDLSGPPLVDGSRYRRRTRPVRGRNGGRGADGGADRPAPGGRAGRRDRDAPAHLGVGHAPRSSTRAAPRPHPRCGGVRDAGGGMPADPRGGRGRWAGSSRRWSQHSSRHCSAPRECSRSPASWSVSSSWP